MIDNRNFKSKGNGVMEAHHLSNGLSVKRKRSKCGFLKMQKIFVILAIVGLSGSVFAQNPSGTCGANLTWELNLSDSVLTISGTGTMTDYNPPTLYPPWNSHSFFKAVVIEDGVTSVGEYAFYANHLFTSVTIGKDVTAIGDLAFIFCKGLISFDVNTNNTFFASENGVLFNKTKTKLVKYPQGNTSATYLIPNSVISIGDYVFLGCNNLTSITIPNGVTTIGEEAFADCIRLSSVIIPNSVTGIGDWAFAGSNGLVSVTVQWINPLSVPNNIFEEVTTQNVKLYVPQGTADKYRAANVWKDFQIEGGVGIAETHQDAGFKVFPNPTNSQLKIKNYELRENSVIEIYSVVGQVVLSTEALKSPETNETTIDVSGLAKGMYFLKVGNQVVRFVKE